MNQSYAWRRFVCPRDATISLADRGFLADPDTQFGASLNEAVVHIEEIERIRSLIILGEPGIGKTHLMLDELERLRSLKEPANSEVLHFDLGIYSTDVWLHNDIFEDPRLEAWKKGSHERFLCQFLSRPR